MLALRHLGRLGQWQRASQPPAVLTLSFLLPHSKQRCVYLDGAVLCTTVYTC